MSKNYRIGIVGVAHMHINNVAALFKDHPQAQLVACADTVPDRPELREGPYTRGWNLKHAMQKLGFARSYTDYREMLAKEKLDIAICCSENAKHAEVVEACAAAKTNVCVEKPMAGTLRDALRMVRAAQQSGITVLVNWPATWDPAAQKAKALIEQGAIGNVLQVKWRGSHRPAGRWRSARGRLGNGRPAHQHRDRRYLVAPRQHRRRRDARLLLLRRDVRPLVHPRPRHLRHRHARQPQQPVGRQR